MPSLTDDVVRGPYKVEGAAVPTATEVHDANARTLREVLKIPALWELIFADCVIPPVSTLYAQLKLAAVSHVVIGKNEALVVTLPSRNWLTGSTSWVTHSRSVPS